MILHAQSTTTTQSQDKVQRRIVSHVGIKLSTANHRDAVCLVINMTENVDLFGSASARFAQSIHAPMLAEKICSQTTPRARDPVA